MCARTESHAWVDDDVVLATGWGRVVRIVNAHQTVNHYRFEALSLPRLVPVFIGSLFAGERDAHVGHQEVVGERLHCLLVVELLLYVCLQAAFHRNECLEPLISQQRAQHVARLFAHRLYSELNLIVLHLYFLRLFLLSEMNMPLWLRS